MLTLFALFALSALSAPQRRKYLVKVIRPFQDISRLGAFAWPDNTPALQQVHQPARLCEPHPELALQHGRGAELAANNQLSRRDQQLEVVADIGVDLARPLRDRLNVVAVLGPRL